MLDVNNSVNSGIPSFSVMSSPVTLATPLAEVPGLGAARVKQLARLELQTVGDVLEHYPRRYEDRRQFPRFPTGASDTPVCVCGIIVKVDNKRLYGRRNMLEVAIEEPEGTALSARLIARWFGMPYLHKAFAVDQRIVFYGKPKLRAKKLVLDHPDFEIIEDDAETTIHVRRITPVYPATEGLSQRVFRALVHQLLESIDLTGVPTRLPATLDPTPRAEAMREIHFPASEATRLAARRHLVLEEFFGLQLAVAARRRAIVDQPGMIRAGSGKLLDQLLGSLAFTPTAAQRRAIAEVRADLAAPRPMNRLLQGDVGSGKTLVAMAAMLCCVEAGYQAALMAPTQILAEQHFLTFRRWLAPLGLRVSLRTGTRKTNDFTPLFDGGEDAQIIIGTHALLYEKARAELPRLGLAVVDEQHKFGVLQRTQLSRGLDGPRPDVLVMSATPIPRTLAITIYGDLDISTLDELPAGRGRVITGVRPAGKRAEAIAFVRQQLAEGRQAYLVHPLIDESDKLEAKAAAAQFEHWSKALAPHPCALLHGRLGADEKELIMTRFRNGEIHALITTTVIEVGVDVPNANLMLVENAERFGLAQLHQLRGRIGRGAHKSYCVLLVDPKADGAMSRLHILEQTSDGFAIAEADLRLRGAGDMLGTDQSGLPPLRIGDLVEDAALMLLARRAAADVMALDPALRRPGHRPFAALLESRRQWVGVAN